MNVLEKTILLFISFFIINTGSCQEKTTNKKLMNTIKHTKKYEFTVTASGSRFYPSEIVNGDFFLADDTSLYIPSGSVMNTGWGGSGATHIVGPDLKALPIGFSITWISYVEKKFYRGKFELDKELIAKYFETGYEDYRNIHENFNEIKVGVAPGGTVIVWINGAGLQIEISRYKAKEVVISKDEFLPNAVISIEEYTHQILEEYLPKEHQNTEFMNTIPYNLWDGYRKMYKWKPIVEFKNKNSKLDIINIQYYNGEYILAHAKNPVLITYNKKAIPKYMSVNWEDHKGNLFGAKIFLGNLYGNTDTVYQEMEREIFHAFKTLSSNNETEITLVLKIDKYNSNIRLFVQNETEKIELTKTKIKTYQRTK